MPSDIDSLVNKYSTELLTSVSPAKIRNERRLGELATQLATAQNEVKHCTTTPVEYIIYTLINTIEIDWDHE